MRRYLIFASDGLSLLMSSINMTVVAVALPNFIKDLVTNVLWAAWTISIYLVGVTSVMPLMGKLSDSFGLTRVILIDILILELRRKAGYNRRLRISCRLTAWTY